MRSPVKAKPVQIHPANGGYVVIVGCQTFVYEVGNVPSLVNDLETYLRAPEEVEKAWVAKYLTNHGEPQEIAPSPLLSARSSLSDAPQYTGIGYTR